MAENIEIKVQDKVDSGVSTKLKNIAKDARAAHADVTKLQNALKTIGASTGLQRLQTELARTAVQQQRLTTEMHRSNAAYLNAETALNRAIVAEQRAAAATAALSAAQSRAATDAQRLATAQTQAATAAQQLATAQANGATAAANAATAQTRTATAATQGQTAAQNLATATTRAGTAQTQAATATARLGTEQQRTATQTANAAAANDRAALAALRLAQAQRQSATATTGATNALGGYIRTAAGILGVGFSANAILATADAYTVLQNKLQNVTTSQDQVNVLTARLFELANETRSGVNETATAFTRFDRALKNLGKSQEESLRLTETVNKALIVGGANAQEAASALLQLSQGFNAGRLQGDEFRAVAENMPMVLDAVARVMNKPIDQIKTLASEGKITAQVLFDAFKLIETEVDATFEKTSVTISQAMTVAGNAVTQFIGEVDKSVGFTKHLAELILILSQGMTGLTDTTNGVSTEFSLLGAIMKGILEVIKVVIVIVSDVWFVFKMTGIEIGAMAAQLAALARLDFAGFSAISDMVKADAAQARKELDAFQARVMAVGMNYTAPTVPSPQTKLRGPGRAPTITDPNAAKAAERRALALEKINKQLDNELSRMFQLAPQREAQAKFDQIEESLIQKKIKLTDSEVMSIKAKIKAIQDAEIVQRQYDSIYAEVTGPLKEYTATQAAAQRLIEQGSITQEQGARAVLKASEAYENALDPMRQYNKDLQQQFDLLNMLPKQREIEQQVMQVQNDMLSKGIVLNAAELQQLREKLVLLQQLNGVSQQEAALLDGSVGKRQQQIDQMTAINKLLADRASGFTQTDALTAISGTDAGQFLVGSPEMLNAQIEQLGLVYEQIDALRQADLISEETAAQARMRIWNAQQNIQLTQAKDFFGSLEGLQSSSNRKLAAIGKAAAITNAVINTYQSATAAYAAMASIPYVGPALGAAAAAAAIAAGMANVAQIRSQNTGFMQGGYTGNMPRDEVAGAVHGREFVMDADATSRIGVANLEALRSGAADMQKGNSAPTAAPASTSAAGAGPSGVGNTTNLRLVNVLDPALIGDYLATPEGEQLFVNTIRKNSDAVRQAIDNG